jgi:hypothetical protein
LNYESTITKESAVCPGVWFTFRRMSEGMRIDLRRKLAEAFGRLRDVAQDREDFNATLAERVAKPLDTITVGELTAAERRQLAAIEERQALVQETEIQPEYFRLGFVRVAGLTIDGQDPDGALLRTAGPPALVREITDAIVAESALTPAERENFGSPTTSGAPVAGPTNDTTAPLASGSDSICSGSAGSTSPAHP